MSTLESESTFEQTEGEQVETSTGTSERSASPPESADDVASGDRSPLSKNVIFDILKNQRRRRVLQYLRERETTTLSDVAEHVSALENDKDVRDLTSSERKRVYVGLYQCHLPRMSDADVIDFDQARGTIELRESTAQMFPYLDLDPHDDAAERGTGLARLPLPALGPRLRSISARSRSR